MRYVLRIASVFSFAAVVFATAAPAYSLSLPPCRDTMRLCPECGVLLNVAEPAGAAPAMENDRPFNPAAKDRRYRTDGSWSFRSLDQRVALCPVCRNHFWRRDAKLAGDPSAASVPEEWRSAPRVHCRTSINWNAAIAGGLAQSAVDLLYLRLNAWWDCNDDDCLAKGENQAASRTNLEAIATMLSSDGPGERLLRAEALRELGRFEEAETQLEAEVSEPYEGVREILLHHVKERATKVGPIPEPCQPTRPHAAAMFCRSVVTGNPDEITRRANDAVLDLVEALANESKLTQAAVERITGRSLRVTQDSYGWKHSQSDVVEDAAIERVRVRESTADPQAETTVFLEIGAGCAISKRDVEARYSRPAGVDFHPGPAGTVASDYDLDGRQVSFITRLDDELVSQIVITAE